MGYEFVGAGWMALMVRFFGHCLAGGLHMGLTSDFACGLGLI